MTAPAKPQEIELKLSLPGQSAEKIVIQKLRECGYTVSGPTIFRNDDLYLDTYDWSLLKKKLSLRYRLENDRAIYTLKSIGKFDKGLAQRDEVEEVLDSPTENPLQIPVKNLRNEVQPLIFPRKLIEMARILTLRKEYSIQTPEGAQISLAFDTSSFSRERHPAMYYRKKAREMEAELKEGSNTALVCLQKLLLDNFNYAASKESKLQRAIELLKLAPLSRKTNPEWTVKLDDPIDIALQKITAAEFSWFREQLPGVIEDYDPEFVHQARVTTRRMRSAIKVFNEAIGRDAGEYLAEELKWLAGLFGTVRDIDVYIINLNGFKQKIDYFPGRARRLLEDAIEKQRRGPLKELLESLHSPRYKKLELRIKKFIRTPAAPDSQTAVKTIRQFAPEVVRRDYQNVIAQGQEVLSHPEMKQFHLLRIEMKKLRYASEFMAPAYGGALDKFIQSTVEIQDCLGELQDTVFTREFSERLIDDWKGKTGDSQVPFILGEIYQYQADIAKERRDMFSGIWSRFTSPETSDLLSRVFDDKNQTP